MCNTPNIDPRPISCLLLLSLRATSQIVGLQWFTRSTIGREIPISVAKWGHQAWVQLFFLLVPNVPRHLLRLYSLLWLNRSVFQRPNLWAPPPLVEYLEKNWYQQLSSHTHQDASLHNLDSELKGMKKTDNAIPFPTNLTSIWES